LVFLVIPFILKGILIGFSIAAPVGPIGVLCIRRTLASGRLAGLLSGLGAATADAFYGLLSAGGLTVISGFLIGHQTWLRLFGGIFLGYLGVKTFLTRPARLVEDEAEPKAISRLKDYSSTFLLTLTNPMTILSFAAIFGGLGLGSTSGGFAPAGFTPAVGLVGGVFLGSTAWWMLLSSGMSLLRRKVSTGWLVWVNRVSGLVIAGFGAAAVLSINF
jgi:threonine/homoserine/homoserine lactone efflux protein